MPKPPTAVMNSDLLRTLRSVLDACDAATCEHTGRVSRLARQLGMSCGLSPDELDQLGTASHLHDLGKIGIPDHILHKPGALDAEEWTVMRRHPEIGARIVRDSGISNADAIARAIRHHHERYDGSGYPDGLAGESIPPIARIIGLADSFDAIAMRRAYHPARTRHEVLAIIDREAESRHDPWIYRRFRTLISDDESFSATYAG